MRLILTAVLVAGLAACTGSAPSIERPEVIRFGSTQSDMVAALEDKCSSLDERVIDPAQIPNVQSHTQIDCQGFDYFGAPRLAELVFADDALVLVWVLVEEVELPAMEEAFIAAYGEPTSKSEDITAFADDNTAVRKDVPEALFYAESVAPLVEARFVPAP